MSLRSLRLASPLSLEEDRITYQVIGGAIAVHRALGPGFLESIYRKAIGVELTKRKLSYECEKPIDVVYNGSVISGQNQDLEPEYADVAIVLRVKPNDGRPAAIMRVSATGSTSVGTRSA